MLLGLYVFLKTLLKHTEERIEDIGQGGMERLYTEQEQDEREMHEIKPQIREACNNLVYNLAENTLEDPDAYPCSVFLAIVEMPPPTHSPLHLLHTIGQEAAIGGVIRQLDCSLQEHIENILARIADSQIYHILCPKMMDVKTYPAILKMIQAVIKAWFEIIPQDVAMIVVEFVPLPMEAAATEIAHSVQAYLAQAQGPPPDPLSALRERLSPDEIESRVQERIKKAALRFKDAPPSEERSLVFELQKFLQEELARLEQPAPIQQPAQGSSSWSIPIVVGCCLVAIVAVVTVTRNRKRSQSKRRTKTTNPNSGRRRQGKRLPGR